MKDIEVKYYLYKLLDNSEQKGSILHRDHLLNSIDYINHLLEQNKKLSYLVDGAWLQNRKLNEQLNSEKSKNSKLLSELDKSKVNLKSKEAELKKLLDNLHL